MTCCGKLSILKLNQQNPWQHSQPGLWVLSAESLQIQQLQVAHGTPMNKSNHWALVKQITERKLQLQYLGVKNPHKTFLFQTPLIIFQATVMFY